MAEKHIARHEHQQHTDEIVDHAHHERIQKHANEQAERARQEKSAENLAKIKELAQQESKSSSNILVGETPDDESNSFAGVQHSLKSTAYARTLAKTQQKLSKPARTFSRIAHNPVIDKISSAGAETVARPSGLLGGSLCAFLGSLIVLYYSKHYGFRYNYLTLFVLFVGGYLIGAIIELLIWFMSGRKRRY